jgi:hypothetical protein
MILQEECARISGNFLQCSVNYGSSHDLTEASSLYAVACFVEGAIPLLWRFQSSDVGVQIVYASMHASFGCRYSR